MHKYLFIAILAAAALLLAGLLVWLRLRPKRRLKMVYFQTRWQTLQKLLPDKKQWPQALAAADKLLDTALKKKHVRGRNPGERLVKAQRLFTDNDGVWFGHKLHKKADADPGYKLKKREVQQALIGLRQGLKDVGALPDAQPKDAK